MPRRAGARGLASVAIREDLDVFEARWQVRDVALLAGFSKHDAEELVLVTSELATNILKFAPPGRIRAEVIDDPDRGPGIRISAIDAGAPLANFDQILAKSRVVGEPMEWTGQGLGGGLGAVYRFTDALRCVPASGGKQLVAERYLRRLRRK